MAYSDTPFATYENYTYNENLSSKLFGLLLTEQHRANAEIKYFYEDYSGRLLATVNTGSGSGYAYTYDVMGRLTRVNPVTYTSASGTYSVNTSAEQVEYSYGSDKRLDTISTPTTEYYLYYDDFGNIREIEAGDCILASYEYDDYNGKLNQINYGNGFYTEYVYNEKEQLAEVKYNGTVRYKYEYTSDGQVYKLTDASAGTYVVYYYDNENRFVGSREFAPSGEENISSKVSYNLSGRVERIRYEYDYNLSSLTADDYISTSYEYLNDGRLSRESISGEDISLNVQYSYDTLDRISSVVYNGSASGDSGSFSNTVTYTYRKDNTYGETGLVSKYTSTVGDNTTTYTYSYDSNGNVRRIISDSGNIYYDYDDLGQLVQVQSSVFGNCSYIYDNSGNIIRKNGNNAVFTYTDSTWGDLLISVNGSSINYDDIGNPTTYYNGLTFTWEGRRLVGATNGTNTYTFTYNADGLRTSKTKNGVTTNYYYSGTLLIKEESPTQTIVYLYDANGSPIGLKFRLSTYAEDIWDEYFYEKNLFGDIVAVYDSIGTKLYSYTYDPWGRFVRTQVFVTPSTAIVNPYLYRGYYYDSDLGFYYLQSRYYDPITCRFINADDISVIAASPASLTDKNLFAYCDNNPVMRVDKNGEFWNWLVGTVVGACGAALAANIQGKEGREFWGSVANGAAAGFIGGVTTDALVITGIPSVGVAIIAYAASGVIGNIAGSLIESCITKQEVNASDLIVDSLFGVATGALFGSIIGSQTNMIDKITRSAGKKALERGINFSYAAAKTSLRELRNIASSFVEEALTSFTSWFIKEYTKYAIGD